MKNDSNNRVPANKHYLSRRVGWIVFIFMLGIGGYLALLDVFDYAYWRRD